MDEWKDGIVNISDCVTVYPGYTFEDFKRTKFYSNQDGIRIIYLDGRCIINEKKYIVGMIFREHKLYLLSLICREADFGQEDEKKRKELHDSILLSNNLSEKNYFEWGKILSEYDQRGNISSINFYYINEKGYLIH